MPRAKAPQIAQDESATRVDSGVVRMRSVCMCACAGRWQVGRGRGRACGDPQDMRWGPALSATGGRAGEPSTEGVGEEQEEQEGC